jgi:hypothetical protein
MDPYSKFPLSCEYHRDSCGLVILLVDWLEGTSSSVPQSPLLLHMQLIRLCNIDLIEIAIKSGHVSPELG